jgi:hypothetical protein
MRLRLKSISPSARSDDHEVSLLQTVGRRFVLDILNQGSQRLAAASF